MISFTVQGVPIPQGSTRAFVVKGRAVTTSANRKTMPWRQQVSGVALSVAPAEQWGGPVHIGMVFRMPRPKSIKPKKRAVPISRPDLDKLTRAILDSLTGIIWVDDAQVASLTAVKEYADHGPPGVDVTLVHLGEGA